MKFLFFFSLNCINTTTFTENLRAFTNSANDLEISYCYFSRSTTFNGYGGVIYMKDISLNLYIHDCIFEFCSSLNGGGAIYILCSSNGEFIMNKVCSHHCFTTLNGYAPGQFLWTFTSNSKKNDLHLSSTLKCAHNNDINRYYSIVFERGNQNITFLNSTNNYCLLYSSFGSYISYTLTMKFNNFYNNTSSESVCIEFLGSNSLNSLEFSNIINNKILSNNRGILSVTNNGNHYINFCILLNNNGYLFNYISGSSLTSQFCYIKHIEEFKGNINFISNFYFITNTFKYIYYSTYLCKNLKKFI